MRITKPLTLGALYRAFSLGGEHYFAVAGLHAFDLLSGVTVLEQHLWQEIMKNLGQEQAFDLCLPKPRAEWLLAGACHAPVGQTINGGSVEVAVANRAKVLAVQGDRYWTAGGVSEVTPFASMPLDWPYAYGGPEHKANPLGRGMAETPDDQGQPRRWLPNVEYPDQLVTSEKDQPRPAGMGRIEVHWEPRIQRAGTYDDEWVKTRAPGLPDDTDTDYFMDAAEDQWLDGYLKGGERYVLRNLHPGQREIRGQIPRIRARAFIRRKDEPDTALEELDTRIDTLWLFPGSLLGVAIHRGVVRCEDMLGQDIAELLLAYEGADDASRSREHYLDALNKRIDPDTGHLWMMTSVDLIPVNQRCDFERMQAAHDLPMEQLTLERQMAVAGDKKTEAEAMIEARKQEVAEELRRQGIDPEPYLQTQSGPDEQTLELQALLDKVCPGFGSEGKLDLTKVNLAALQEVEDYLRAMAEGKRDQAITDAEKQLAELRDNLLAAAVVPYDAPVQAKLAEIEDQIRRLREPPPLPRVDAEAVFQQMEQQHKEAIKSRERALAQGVNPAELPAMDLQVDALREQLAQAQSMARDAYRQGAHWMDEGSSPHPGREDALRDMLAKAAGVRPEASDFACVNLGGLNLRGVDLSDCYLEQIDATNADFEGAVLLGAIMPRARLHGTRFIGADLRKANIGRSHMLDADFSRANLVEATLGEAHMEKASFREADLQGVIWLATEFGEVEFDGANLGGAMILDADLSRCRFKDGKLAEANFLRCDFTGVDFSGADLQSVSFVECRLEGARFDGANMENTRFVGGCKLTGASFLRARLIRANLRDTEAVDCDFREADLSMSDLSGANMRRAKLSGVTAIRTLCNGTEFTGAQMQSGNWMESALQQARLLGADFSDSNLYGANFIQATLGETRFDRANLDRTLLEQWRPA